MKLLTATPQPITPGYYNIKMDMSSGDARIQWKLEVDTFQDVPDSIKTASTGFTVQLPNCIVQSLITGDATVEITPVEK